MSGLSKDVLKVQFGPECSKLQDLNVGGRGKNCKNPTTYILNAILYTESLLFGRPAFESWSGQRLKVCIFAFPWPTKMHTTSFERSNIFLYRKAKNSLKKHFKGII